RHKLISQKLDCEFYFAHPYSSWERGLSEYTNKLVRQYIPKKSTFNPYDNEFVKQVQYKINRRPRKILDFETPKDLFFKFVA
ncbi:MAG: IS30 family transposase, partial [Mangrovibacterium sp.]